MLAQSLGADVLDRANARPGRAVLGLLDPDRVAKVAADSPFKLCLLERGEVPIGFDHRREAKVVRELVLGGVLRRVVDGSSHSPTTLLGRGRTSPLGRARSAPPSGSSSHTETIGKDRFSV